MGCSKTDSKTIINKFKNVVENENYYTLTGQMDIVSNEEMYNYEVNVNYLKPDYYRVSLKNVQSNNEQIILKNKNGTYVVTPSLNKSFKFQSDWPDNNSQSYLLDSIAKDLKDDSAYKFTQKDKDYIFTTKTNYPNNPKYVKQNIVLDKNQKLKKVEVQDENDTTYIEFTTSKIDNKAKFDDNQFDLKETTKNFNNEEQNNTQEKTTNSENTEHKEDQITNNESNK